MGMPFEQLNLEDFLKVDEVLPKVIPFQKGDQVRVIVPEIDLDSESHYYLSDFERIRGQILKVVGQPSLQYHVDFDGRLGIVHHEEIIGW